MIGWLAVSLIGSQNCVHYVSVTKLEISGVSIGQTHPLITRSYDYQQYDLLAASTLTALASIPSKDAGIIKFRMATFSKFMAGKTPGSEIISNAPGCRLFHDEPN
jgi:hypothetical protein